MTWRAVYGEPFPEHADFATEVEAHEFALRVSRETGEEVAVIEIGGALDFLARCRHLGERGLASGLVAQLRQAGEDVILRAYERMSDEEIRSVSEKYAEFREGDGQGGVKTGAGVAHGGPTGSPEGDCPEAGVQALTEAHSDRGGNE